MKKLIVFDLDGTLAVSKAPLAPAMGQLLLRLLASVKGAIISGGDWPQFQKQIVSRLPPGTNLGNLSLLPTCGTKFYEYGSAWTQVYADLFTAGERDKIIASLRTVVAQLGLEPAKAWGEVIEDRGSQITFSALGQEAPIEAKTPWDPGFEKRQKMKVLLDGLIPEFSIRLGGTTSVDITKPGIDKGYGIRKLRDILGIAISEMLFVGDALFPGGNDYPAKEAGAESISVAGPEETEKVVEVLLACL